MKGMVLYLVFGTYLVAYLSNQRRDCQHDGIQSNRTHIQSQKRHCSSMLDQRRSLLHNHKDMLFLWLEVIPSLPKYRLVINLLYHYRADPFKAIQSMTLPNNSPSRVTGSVRCYCILKRSFSPHANQRLSSEIPAAHGQAAFTRKETGRKKGIN